MSASSICRVVCTALWLVPLVSAQANAQESTATCNLDDGRQVYIRYTPVASNKEKIANGKPWTPGGTAMTLFTEAPLTLANSAIPVGAYTVYPIPSREHWTLAVNRNVTAGAAYDEKADLARAPMETAQVPQPVDTLELAFAHVGPRCTLRIYFGKTAAFVDFMAK